MERKPNRNKKKLEVPGAKGSNSLNTKTKGNGTKKNWKKSPKDIISNIENINLSELPENTRIGEMLKMIHFARELGATDKEIQNIKTKWYATDTNAFINFQKEEEKLITKNKRLTPILLTQSIDFGNSQQMTKELNDIFEKIGSINSELFGKLKGISDERKAMYLTLLNMSILELLVKNQGRILERQQKIVRILEKYGEIYGDFDDEFVRMAKLKEIMNLVGVPAIFLKKNKQGQQGKPVYQGQQQGRR